MCFTSSSAVFDYSSLTKTIFGQYSETKIKLANWVTEVEIPASKTLLFPVGVQTNFNHNLIENNDPVRRHQNIFPNPVPFDVASGTEYVAFIPCTSTAYNAIKATEKKKKFAFTYGIIDEIFLIWIAPTCPYMATWYLFVHSFLFYNSLSVFFQTILSFPPLLFLFLPWTILPSAIVMFLLPFGAELCPNARRKWIPKLFFIVRAIVFNYLIIELYLMSFMAFGINLTIASNTYLKVL